MARRLLQNLFSSTFNQTLKRCCRLSAIPTSISFLVAANTVNDLSAENHQTKLVVPDPSTLSHTYLLQNASSVTVDSVCALINQATAAAIHAESQYAKAIYALIKLLDYQTDTQSSLNDELWDLIIQQKSQVEEHKVQRVQLEVVISSVEKLADAAAEAAFSIGAESLAIILNDHFRSSQTQLSLYKSISSKAERDLIDAQMNEIQSAGENDVHSKDSGLKPPSKSPSKKSRDSIQSKASKSKSIKSSKSGTSPKPSQQPKEPTEQASETALKPGGLYPKPSSESIHSGKWLEPGTPIPTSSADFPDNAEKNPDNSQKIPDSGDVSPGLVSPKQDTKNDDNKSQKSNKSKKSAKSHHHHDIPVKFP